MFRSGRAVSAAFCAAALLVGLHPSSSAEFRDCPFRLHAQRLAHASEPALSPSAGASPAEPEEPEWKTFTMPDGGLMFDYPPDWTVQDRAREAAPGGIFVDRPSTRPGNQWQRCGPTSRPRPNAPRSIRMP